MKRITLLALALGFGISGCQAVTDLVNPPDRAACKRLTALCGVNEKDQDECARNFQKLEKEQLRQMATCMDKATSCAEAGGCAAGVGASIAVDQMNKFFKGFKRALGEDPAPR